MLEKKKQTKKKPGGTDNNQELGLQPTGKDTNGGTTAKKKKTQKTCGWSQLAVYYECRKRSVDNANFHRRKLNSALFFFNVCQHCGNAANI